LLTGQRRQELGGLRWTEVNFADRLITLPADRCKNGRSHTVPLSSMAYEILAARHTLLSARAPSHSPNGNTGLVFGQGRNGYGAWTDGKLALDRRLSAMAPLALA
jgi:integrase